MEEEMAREESELDEQEEDSERRSWKDSWKESEESEEEQESEMETEEERSEQKEQTSDSEVSAVELSWLRGRGEGLRGEDRRKKTSEQPSRLCAPSVALRTASTILLAFALAAMRSRGR